VLAARLVLDFQTIISREVSPLEPAVLTVGSIHGGTRYNIIPPEVDLQLTIRTYNMAVRQQILDAIKRICNGVAMSANLPPDKYPQIAFSVESTPPTINNAALTAKCSASFSRIIGSENVIVVSPEMAGEDFGQYGNTKEQIPISLTWLGTVSKEKMNESKLKNTQLAALHSPYFFPDTETTIKTGVKCMVTNIIDLMKVKN